MLVVGKMERMEGEDFYNDDWNIDEMEAKEELPEELKGLMEDWKNIKFNGNPVSKHIHSNYSCPLLGNAFSSVGFICRFYIQ